MTSALTNPPEIRFDDGAAYEVLMGRWSRLVGEKFLAWLRPAPDRHWLDIGCGNGAFTELLFERTRPASVQGFDPSAAQLDYAAKRFAPGTPVRWIEAGAMQLPVADASADGALMALVLFFVPDPAQGLTEMVRTVKPGGTIAAYHWDMLGGGFPLAAIGAEMRKMGLEPRLPPSVEVSTLDASRALWTQSGLLEVRTEVIEVQRNFQDFDEYWRSALSSNTLRPMFEAMDEAGRASLQANVRQRLNDAGGPLTVQARAHAVRGIRP